MHRRSFLTASAAVLTAAAMPWSPSRAMESLPLLRLNANENPLGMSPMARAAAAEALTQGHRYSFGVEGLLAQEIAELEGVEKANVTIANGSTGILEAVVWQQAMRGGTLVQPEITFGAVGEIAAAAQLGRIDVPMLDGFRVDLEAMEAAAAKVDGPVLVYLVTPNNPTGLLIPHAAIEAWVRRAPDNVFFLIDEAYHELVDDASYRSCVGLLREGRENLLIARTFSKIYAMAGMRLGYAMAAESVVGALQKYYSSWSINIAAMQAGRASLKDEEFRTLSFSSNRSARDFTQKGLADLGLNFIPSQGNFLIHEIRMPLKDYQQKMSQAGILVGRDMGLGYGWNRLSIGTPDEMERFMATLASLHSGGWS
ncbi:MAG: histidinol-phosphate transaminase [Halieaceae bacterium]|jgi:histidinol-phosphate aminotransferase|nr:histidinol-phosphate transaminase [Halieaceae bacterium]